MKRRKSRFVDQRDVEACIDQLQNIIDGLRAGSMAVEEEDQALLLCPRGPLDFEVRVEQLGTKETLRVEMSWKLPSQRTARANAARANAAPVSGRREALESSSWEGPISVRPARGVPALEAAGTAEAAAVPRVEDVLAADTLEPEAAEMEVQDADILDGDVLDGDVLDGDVLDTADEVSVTTLRPLRRTRTACTCSARSLELPSASWSEQRSGIDEYHQLYADACTVGSDGLWHIDRDRLVQSLANAGVDPLTQQELYSLALQADVDRTSSFRERVVAALERASQHPLAAAG